MEHMVLTTPIYRQFAAHTFGNLESATFDPVTYSRLKFGCDNAARQYGYQLAERFFRAHADVLIANSCVVISSPYNYIPNAATVMTGHFVDKLNELLILASGRAVEYSVVHRKVSYTNDYGFLSREKRKGLIDNDSFYLNKGFVAGKLLLFVDDVRITGTHEDKLREVLLHNRVANDAFFLYFASYTGTKPDIEGELNFSYVKSIDDYLALTKEPNHHVIIRPIKYILGQTERVLRGLLPQFSDTYFYRLFYGCLAEGYYKIPSYQSNFGLIVDEKARREGSLPKADCVVLRPC